MGRLLWKEDKLPQVNALVLRSPLAFPDRPSPPRWANPTSQLGSKGSPRLKNWSPTGYGASGPYYKRP